MSKKGENSDNNSGKAPLLNSLSIHRSVCFYEQMFSQDYHQNCFRSGPGCLKLTTLLVNVSLNFQKLISKICQYFLLKKCEKLLQLLSFFQQKISVYLVLKS